MISIQTKLSGTRNIFRPPYLLWRATCSRCSWDGVWFRKQEAAATEGRLHEFECDPKPPAPPAAFETWVAALRKEVA